jgi:hypothetical protein
MAKSRETDLLTVAAVRPGADKTTEFLFYERQQVFRLSEKAGADDSAARMLRARAGKGQPLKVTLNPKRGTIERISEPRERQTAEFLRLRAPLKKPQKIVPIDLAKIDPIKFNIVDLYLKWPVFRLCTDTVPSYAKAKQIFDYCAALSCNLPGPYAVNPCIPFQYVIDGCYARAHQMRRIITTHFGYCCEKVFSFGMDGDTLAVKADKWGGCCVFWWYHVAPLIRVRFKIPKFNFTLAMVIDPSMFDKPVLLHTWLAAQENKNCAANAHVTKYSIQPGSAYWPIYPGNSFGTDPNYTLTEGTLQDYANLTTC